MNNKTLIDSINQLGVQEPFAYLVESIRQTRESAISDLYTGKTPEEVFRATGEIKALDQLLLTLKYEEVLERWKDVLKAKEIAKN